MNEIQISRRHLYYREKTRDEYEQNALINSLRSKAIVFQGAFVSFNVFFNFDMFGKYLKVVEKIP